MDWKQKPITFLKLQSYIRIISRYRMTKISYEMKIDFFLNKLLLKI